MDEIGSTHQKALRINQDGGWFGTFAEIGAGQEVVRWFFRVGKAAATVAKSISAYDTTVSDEIYGPSDHYVSRGRLSAMLDHEYKRTAERLGQKRGEGTKFFAFAETVATHTRPHHGGGHAWIGVRFQHAPRRDPSEVVLHVQLLDSVTASEQDAIGKLGVNLLHGAFFDSANPEKVIAGLLDDLTRDRIEVDVIKFSGPAFSEVDNRLMSLKLLEHNLTNAAMFTPQGEAIQASEALFGKSVLIERGRFRPLTNVAVDMMNHAMEQLQRDPKIESDGCLVLMEMSTRGLTNTVPFDPADLLARADTLSALGKMVMITNYAHFYEIFEYLRQYTDRWIVMAVGMPLLGEIFNEKYYTDLDGGILEAVGRFFKERVKLYVYPMKEAAGGDVSGVESLEVPPKLRHLAEYLVDNEFIQPITDFESAQLHIFSREVLARIQNGGDGWEQFVPAPVAQMIKSRNLFGYRSL